MTNIGGALGKIGLVARRDFVATVSNKGFVIGLLIMPAIIVVLAVLGPRIVSARAPQVRGDVALIDPTGRVASELAETLSPSAIEGRRADEARRAISQAVGGDGAQLASRTQDRVGGQVPLLRIVERPDDVAREKNWLADQRDGERRLALIVIHANAIARTASLDYGSYDLFVSRTLDNATEEVINDGLRQALINLRLRASSLDRPTIEAMMHVPAPRSVIVTPAGEQQAQRGFTRALPLILGVLLFTGVMLGGQTLMTSTVEEKSSRVVEVLLASVSSFELMAGKLVGQLGVGLLVMSVYIGLGGLTLWSFTMLGLVEPLLVVYLFVFFFLTYLVFGALMLSIGAAVNQMADAQSLMGPVIVLLVVPYVLSPIIGRAPNSTFSVIVSFIPPVNTFAMMSRLASDAPPPAWQVWLTVAVGMGAALAAVWFAAKIFRIGLLMHGKPPNFATLIRWARAA
jgi:ABC-type Na+ efflux pump permease subunit